MAALDWSQCPAVESIPGKISGASVFRRTRTRSRWSLRIWKTVTVDDAMEPFPVTR